MKNKKTSTDATVREDFPGGCKEDPVSRFTKEGRNENENHVFDHVSRLARFRKNSSALTMGKTMHFIPKDGIYLYFRYDARQTVMVISNTGDKTIKPDWNIYKERMSRFTKARDIGSGKIQILEGWEIRPGESFVMELLD